MRGVTRVAEVVKHRIAGHGQRAEGGHLVLAAQFELDSKLESGLSYFGFKRLVPGAFNVGLIGSICNALPRPPSRAGHAARPA